MSIAPGSLVLAVGMTRHLVAMFVPEDADNPKVTWSSGNPGVATVAKDGGGVFLHDNDRFMGYSVRPVYGK